MSSNDTQSPQGSLRISVIKARGLKPKGKSGFNNPYVIIEIDGKRLKTDFVEYTCDPVWNEELYVKVPEPHVRSIKFFVYHHSRGVRSDVIIGVADAEVTDIASAPMIESWIKLEAFPPKPWSDMNRGEIQVSLQLVDPIRDAVIPVTKSQEDFTWTEGSYRKSINGKESTQSQSWCESGNSNNNNNNNQDIQESTKKSVSKSRKIKPFNAEIQESSTDPITTEKSEYKSKSRKIHPGPPSTSASNNNNSHTSATAAFLNSNSSPITMPDSPGAAEDKQTIKHLLSVIVRQEQEISSLKKQLQQALQHDSDSEGYGSEPKDAVDDEDRPRTRAAKNVVKAKLETIRNKVEHRL